jgi:hypothetical protein
MFSVPARIGFVAVLAALLSSLALAAPGGAVPSSKPYTVTIAPGSVSYEAPGNGLVASGETVQITATITNPSSSSQQIGSADMSWPSGFNVLNTSQYPLSTSAGTASLSSSCSYTYPNAPSPGGPCVALRNLSLAAGSSATVTMWVTTPACQQGNNFPWYVEAHQANNYISGGNVFTNPPSGNLNSSLDGACSVAWGTEPANTQTGKTISGTAFTPEPSGPALTVNVENSSGSTVATNTAPVTVGVGSNPGAATLGGTLTQPSSGGTATFADLTLSRPGSPYTLSASSGTLGSATSTQFAVQDQVASCAPGDTSCTTTDGTGDGNQAQVQATPTSSGLLTESVSFNDGAQLNCAGYTSLDPNTYTFITPNGWGKTGTITIIPTTNLGNAKQVLKAQQICFGAPYEFTTASGSPAGAGTLPDGSSGFIGLLPNCPGNLSNATGPCHDRGADTTIPDHHNKSGYDVVLVEFIPTGLPGDPHTR